MFARRRADHCAVFIDDYGTGTASTNVNAKNVARKASYCFCICCRVSRTIATNLRAVSTISLV
jgi:hypothetical protein